MTSQNPTDHNLLAGDIVAVAPPAPTKLAVVIQMWDGDPLVALEPDEMLLLQAEDPVGWAREQARVDRWCDGYAATAWRGTNAIRR